MSMQTTSAAPHSHEAERAVLSGILLEPAALGAAQSLGLRSSDFYADGHAIAYEALCGLDAAAVSIDSVTLRDWLKGLGKLDKLVLQPGGQRGDEAILALTDTIPMLSNTLDHARIVLDKSRRRQVRARLLQGVAAATTGELGDALEFAQQAQEVERGSSVPLFGLRALIQVAEDSARASAGRGVGGVKTGFRLVDQAFGPMAPGEVLTIGGRSGCGKSHILLQIALRAALAGRRVGVISCEDPKRRWGTRAAVALEPGLSAAIMQLPQLNFEQSSRIDRVKQMADAVQLRYADCYNEPIEKVIAAMEAVAADGCELIVVDHMHAIQLRARKGETTADVVSDAVRQVCRVSRRANAVLAMGAQLGRAKDGKAFGEPNMFDFRDTSQFEISSDYMLLTWKPSDADGASIFAKVGKLKDTPARPRFRLEFASNGALYDLQAYEPPAEPDQSSARGWRA